MSLCWIWLKVNYEGAFCHSLQMAGIGTVVRNRLGELVNGKEKQIKAKSSLLVEALASKEGLKLAAEQKYQKVIFESDSEVVDSNLKQKRERQVRKTSFLKYI